MSSDPDFLLRALVDLSSRAGALVRAKREEGFEVRYKGPNDPVTSADLAANELIRSELARRFPDIPVVAEESDPESYADYVRAPRAFFVDPIDGTREFIAGSVEFVVMIGLAEAGRAELGVVAAPVLGTTWFGRRGASAHRLHEGRTTPIVTSAVTTLSEATLLVSQPPIDPALGWLRPGKVQSVGSAGLKGARIAEGSADLYASFGVAGKLWDACDIDALLHAAGGTLTDTKGRALNYQRTRLDNDDGLLATNGPLLAPVIEQLS